MSSYRVQVQRFMDSSLPRNGLVWHWVGDYYRTIEHAREVAERFREVYVTVRIIHGGEIVD